MKKNYASPPPDLDLVSKHSPVVMASRLVWFRRVVGHHIPKASQALEQRVRLTTGREKHSGQTFKPTAVLPDLQRVASDITSTLSAAISDLKTDIQAVATHLSNVEQTAQLHSAAIRQVQRTYDTQLSYIFYLHHQVEDLDNWGRRHIIRVWGVPDGIGAGTLPQIICTIFNDLLGHPADRDVICCVVNFPLKEEILRKARKRGCILHNGTEIKLFQDLSQITLQNRRTLHPFLELLRSYNIQYRWTFPFCLSASARGRTALLHSPEDLQVFCEQLDLRLTDLTDWCAFHFPTEPWSLVSHNPSPKAQRQRSRRRRLDPYSPGIHVSHRDMNQHGPGPSATP